MCSPDKAPQTPKVALSFSAELRHVINERNILTSRTRKKVLYALEDADRRSIQEKHEHLKNEALQEIYSSEMKYLQQLEIIMKFFMEPLEKNEFLPNKEFRILFGHIPSIYAVNGELLRELKQDPTAVIPALSRLAPFLKLYAAQAADHQQAMSLLQNLPKSFPQAFRFISNQEGRPEVSIKLGALLIAPIQRLPRYRLLLREVIRFTEKDDLDLPSIKKALEAVEMATSHVDSYVKQQDEAHRLALLQKNLIAGPNIAQPGRTLIREGYLLKVSSGGGRGIPCHLTLLNDCIIYSRPVGRCVENGPVKWRYTIPISHCSLETSLGDAVFRITDTSPGGISLLLFSKDRREGQAWVKALKQLFLSRNVVQSPNPKLIPIVQPNQEFFNNHRKTSFHQQRSFKMKTFQTLQGFYRNIRLRLMY